MKKELICIICPRGCSLCAEIEEGSVKVSGNACPKGEQYAIDECTHPLRTVTSTVRVGNRVDTMLSVKTDAAVAKENIFDVMKVIRSTVVNAPVSIGDVIIKGVYGANVIATKDIS